MPDETIESLRAEVADRDKRIASMGQQLESWADLGVTVEGVRKLQSDNLRLQESGLVKRIEAAERVAADHAEALKAVDGERAEVAMLGAMLTAGVPPAARRDVMSRAKSDGLSRAEDGAAQVGEVAAETWLGDLRRDSPHLFNAPITTGTGGGVPWSGFHSGGAPPDDGGGELTKSDAQRILSRHGVPKTEWGEYL